MNELNEFWLKWMIDQITLAQKKLDSYCNWCDQASVFLPLGSAFCYSGSYQPSHFPLEMPGQQPPSQPPFLNPMGKRETTVPLSHSKSPNSFWLASLRSHDHPDPIYVDKEMWYSDWLKTCIPSSIHGAQVKFHPEGVGEFFSNQTLGPK